MLVQSAIVMAEENISCSDQLPRGVILSRNLPTDSQLKYYYYLPQRCTQQSNVFVTIHGISRNAEEHARKFAPYAEQYGVILIAPYFSENHFPDYQRLGRKGRGKRADLALQEIIKDISKLTGINLPEKIYIFGYSGGAQFAHRYMLAYPKQVAKVVLGAPGWYTFPDISQKFPKGIQASPTLPHLTFNPSDFLRIPACVLVGEFDKQRDTELNQSQKIDRLQGENRIERGQRWIAEMTRQSRQLGLTTPYHFKLIPNSPHSFSLSMLKGGMGEKTFAFLFDRN